jgi:coatomer subunit beta'
MDKSLTMVSYELNYQLIQYQQAVIANDQENANKIFTTIPKELHLKVAKFLETNERKELAYMITPDPTHKLDLAIELGLLKDALAMAKEAKKISCWKQVGDLALSMGFFEDAESCFLEAKDLSSLFLLYTATGNREGLQKLQGMSEQMGEANLNFFSNFLLVF